MSDAFDPAKLTNFNFLGIITWLLICYDCAIPPWKASWLTNTKKLYFLCDDGQIRQSVALLLVFMLCCNTNFCEIRGLHNE